MATSVPTTRILTTTSGIEVIRRISPCREDRVLRHLIIVAGQHGCERGPVLGLLAHSASDLVERANHGLVTIIRCANPYGFSRGLRLDGAGSDPNRGWHIDRPLHGVQAEIWNAVLEGEALYVGARPPVERTVIDMHSSTEDALARTVCYSGGDRSFAAGAAAELAEHAHGSPYDRAWMLLTMHEAVESVRATAPNVTAAGSLAEFVNWLGGTAITVEFPASTYDVAASTLGPLERSLGEAIQVCWSSRGHWRPLSMNEATAGVAALVRWAIKQNAAGR